MNLARTLPALLLAFCAAALRLSSRAHSGEESGNRPAITAEELRDYVRRLACDEWKGRSAGSPEEILATDFIAGALASFGLEPGGEGGTWFQEVPMAAGFQVDPSSAFRLSDDGAPAFALDKDFRPLSVSASGHLEGQLVFAGYGISAPDLGYDDFAGVEVRGRIAVVFRRSPHGGKWEDNAAKMRHAPFLIKLQQAADRGALALIVVNDPAGTRNGEDAFQTASVGGGKPRIPYLHMTLAAARRLFPSAFQATPEEVEAMIHAGGEPMPCSRESPMRARLDVTVREVIAKGRNVCGLLRAGAAEPVDEIVVIGAHHDHLGVGQPGSLARSAAEAREIHNGADDNASGTSGLLEIACNLAARRGELRRSVLFLTFTGEERGLLGSLHFCEHPTVPLDKVVSMLNMDMIGRLEKGALFIGGTGTSPVFRPLLEQLIPGTGLRVQFGDGGLAPSDNTSFYRRNLPVLFFFTGMHEDYHRPGDDWEKIDADGASRVAALVCACAFHLATSPERPAFRRADEGGFGPKQIRLGIVPGRHEKGVLVSGLQGDGAAARAGVKEGDVILELGGVPTPDLEALRRALRDRKEGEKAAIRVLRGEGDILTLEALLEAR